MSTRREWRPIQAELAQTASLALWGLWAVCILLVGAMVLALAKPIAEVVF